MAKKKKLSNPFSTGGGGHRFEVHVQASFVTLMLTSGYAPCLPCWPIEEIKLQGKIDGFEVDDLIVSVENTNNKERRRLLGQIKRSITITKGSTLFGEVIQAAWDDFNNPEVFTRSKDVIALITGPLSASDTDNVQWLLSQARITNKVDEFLRRVQQANFSPTKSVEKLDVIRHHLNLANGCVDVSNEELYEFLRHFHLLGYDLDKELGVVLSLLHSHISQFHQENPQWVWSRIVDTVQTWNQGAGTITRDGLPKDLLDAVQHRVAAKIPQEFKLASEKSATDWSTHSEATYLALAVLLGAWNEKNQCDLAVVAQLLGTEYESWLKKAREILQIPDGPLSLKDGVWRVVNRAELWSALGARILDQDLDRFRNLAITVLNEHDPAFDLPIEQRYAANIYGKASKYSRVLRDGIADGIAMLGSLPDVCVSCTYGKAEETCLLVLRQLLTDANWILWGSLQTLLPQLAEGAPGEFLKAVERALRLNPCPFDELFAQERNGIDGTNYLTGLLWALEGLAWDEQHLVRVCVALGELARRDPGGRWANRPSNSLSHILMPWHPQTLATADKRKAVVQTIAKESPEVAWNLIMSLLPGHHQISLGTYKPKWRNVALSDQKTRVTRNEYLAQTAFYGQLAVGIAGVDRAKLLALIDRFNDLPEPAFDLLVDTLSSQPISTLAEEQRLPLWNHLTRLTNKHRRFANAEWALPEKILVRVEQVANQLAPSSSFSLYQPLFNNRDFDLYEGNGEWQEQKKKLNTRRDKAIFEIFQENGVAGVIRFAESVTSPGSVGGAFGVIADDQCDQSLLPHFLSATEKKHKALVAGFTQRRHDTRGWTWGDNIDKTGWTPQQVGQFLAYLPFTQSAWDRAAAWLLEGEGEYWTRTDANPYPGDNDYSFAVEKLLKHGRPNAAINCLDWMCHAKKPVNVDQCIRALMGVSSTSEPSSIIDAHQIVELIQHLQQDSTVSKDELFKVEWAYLPLLDRHHGVAPKSLESKLASNPEFFCELIQLIYRSTKEGQSLREHASEEIAIAENAWRLLNEWRMPPGLQQDGTFNAAHFKNWLQRARVLCTESGHLEVALTELGKVLTNAPSDPDGLWIHRAVATALDDHDTEAMRDGFTTETYNSRGAYSVDPTGAPERKLAEQLRNKAEEVENASFPRFATTLRELADGYEREAKRVINEYRS